LFNTGNLRRVKKFEINFNTKHDGVCFDLTSCTRGQTIARPIVSTGYHRGLERTFGLFCKEIRDKGLLNDKEIIDALLDSNTLSRNRAVALVATWNPK